MKEEGGEEQSRWEKRMEGVKMTEGRRDQQTRNVSISYKMLVKYPD